jgi:hypothetical protein
LPGPFGLPWSTFSAIIVVVLSIALAVVWAIAAGGDGKGGDDE